MLYYKDVLCFNCSLTVTLNTLTVKFKKDNVCVDSQFCCVMMQRSRLVKNLLYQCVVSGSTQAFISCDIVYKCCTMIYACVGQMLHFFKVCCGELSCRNTSELVHWIHLRCVQSCGVCVLGFRPLKLTAVQGCVFSFKMRLPETPKLLSQNLILFMVTSYLSTATSDCVYRLLW